MIGLKRYSNILSLINYDNNFEYLCIECIDNKYESFIVKTHDIEDISNIVIMVKILSYNQIISLKKMVYPLILNSIGNRWTYKKNPKILSYLIDIITRIFRKGIFVKENNKEVKNNKNSKRKKIFKVTVFSSKNNRSNRDKD